jgi:hypothetical protein
MTQARDLADGKFDTNTLVVDAANNRVGVGTTSPADHLAVVASGANAHISVDRSDGATGRTVLIHSSSGGQLQTTGSVPLIFGTADTERGRFLAGGGLTFNGDTATANALDDYEEGTWTPTVSTGYSSVPTYVAQQGTYTKIGRLVTCHCRLEISAGTQAGSAFSITGLPFTVRSTNPNGGGFTTYQNNFHSTDDFYPFADSNSTSIFFHEENGTAVNANELDGTAWEIRMIIIYEQN